MKRKWIIPLVAAMVVAGAGLASAGPTTSPGPSVSGSLLGGPPVPHMTPGQKVPASVLAKLEDQQRLAKARTEGPHPVSLALPSAAAAPTVQKSVVRSYSIMGGPALPHMHPGQVLSPAILQQLERARLASAAFAASPAASASTPAVNDPARR